MFVKLHSTDFIFFNFRRMHYLEIALCLLEDLATSIAPLLRSKSGILQAHARFNIRTRVCGSHVGAGTLAGPQTPLSAEK
jgi:hypothetical protein